jgi:hypothetical protein
MSQLFALESSLMTIIDVLKTQLSSRLKQQALIFDSIGIVDLDILLEFFNTRDTHSDERFTVSRMELEWLKENGIVFEPLIPPGNLQTLLTTTVGKRYATKYLEADNELSKLLNKRKLRRPSDLDDIVMAIATQESVILRLLSATIERDNSSIATTLSETDYTHPIPYAERTAVIQVVVRKLPLPDNTTPWEKIIDYRSDAANQKNLLGLRRWIRKISTEELSKAEIEDEIEWRINEFQEHMKYHKIRANTEALEVLVKAPLEIIESLVKLKFSKIPEPFFALKKKQLRLMEAEINAPNKELAYIINSRETFQSQE